MFLRFVCQILSVSLGITLLSAGEVAKLPAQKVGPNDLVSVSVYNSPELTQTVRIGPDGTLRLPMMKHAVEASGLLPAELEKEIAQALADEQLVVDPFVTVSVAEYNSRAISVAGAVKSPLTFQAAGSLRLLEALTRAGGLLPTAGSEILVTRPRVSAAPELVRVPVRALIDQADPQLNILLEGGEEIRVPELGKVFVVGNVRRPGAYPVDRGEESSVLKMLALAEGLSQFAGRQAFIYRREEESAQRREIVVNLRDILKRRQSDMALLANDILYVPEAGGKKAGLAALERILTFGSTVGSGAIVYGAVR